MSLKSILAVPSASTDDFALLSAGAKIAARLSAFLQVVPAFPDPAADYASFGVALSGASQRAIVERVAEGERATQEAIEAMARAAIGEAADEGTRPSFAVARRGLTPAVDVSRAAALADVVLFGGAAARGVLNGLFAEILLAGRAPCLIVNRAVDFGAAAIAWDGSVEAGRAVRAALPLLEAASEIFVVRNTDDQRDGPAADVDGLQDYLARHGIRRLGAVDVGGGAVAESVISAALARNCDLIVAGAYGRPRLYETLLGGATRGFVGAERAPNLLLAH